MAQITTDPHENLIVSADIALEARKIDFVTQFAKNWDALREVMGITRPIRKANGTELYVKYAEGELQSGDVAEGAFIPRSHFTVKEKTFGKIKIEKYAKEVSVEAVADHGYDAAVDMTDEEFLVQLQDVISDRFYTQLKAGEMTFEEKTFQMAFAMALGKVKDKFKQMHRNVTGIAVFVNTLDLYAYLGSSAITIQTAFGFNYLENFLGAERTFVSSEIPRGTMIATPLNNIISYYVDPGDSEFSRMGLQYTVDGETNLVGFAVQGDYDRATSVSYALMGFTLMAEYIDAIAVVKINPSAEHPESEATDGDTGSLGEITVSASKGTGDGMFKVSVTGDKANGANVYKYKISETAPEVKYHQDLTNWDLWDGKAEIAGTAGHHIRVVETNPAYKALKSGETELAGE